MTTTMDEAPVDAYADAKQPRHVVVKFVVSCHRYSFYLNLS